MGGLGEQLRQNERLMAEIVKRSRQETKEEADLRRRTICKRCGYYSQSIKCCNYTVVTGHIRPCSPMDCKEMGIWQRNINMNQ